MEHIDDVCYMESCFGLFVDIVSFNARYVQSLCLMHHSLKNHFGHTIWYSWVKSLKWKFYLVSLEIVLILM